MSENLYFITIIAKALQAPDIEKALRKAFCKIKQMGAEERYAEGDSQKAVISAIMARGEEQQAEDKRLRFCGTVKFSGSIRKRIKDTILPIIDRIVDTLDLDGKNFEISAVNLGAASALDVGVTVTGLSADVPIFIAMLSEALQISVSNNFVTTGHIASVEGDISTVKGIPAKVEAAKNDGTIKHFIYGDLENDESLKVLSPNERNRSIDAIMAARDSLHTRAVNGIGQLIRLVFTEENIVMASLREGFFCLSMILDQFNNPVQDVVSFLTENNQKRFWDILDYHFLSGHCEKGRELLRSFAQFYIRRKKYPKGFGARLFQLIRSVPPALRKLKIAFPILDQGLFNDLITFAGNDDNDDIPLLLDAARGRNIANSNPINIQPEIKVSDSESMVFDTIVSMINEQALAEKFGIIDSTRACFVLEQPKFETFQEFIDVLETYIIHLQRYIGSSFEIPNTDAPRNKAVELLKNTFNNKGGDKAAFVQARNGTQGGIRFILDMITEQCKAEKQDAYIDRVLKDAIPDMTLDERVKCIQAIMKKIGPFLPEEIRNQPMKRFARNDDTLRTIILMYVKCRDKFNQSLSSM